MQDPQPTLHRRPEGKPVFRLAALVTVLIFVVVCAAAIIISQILLAPPVLPDISEYLQRGDAYLADEQYAEAITQYGFAIDAVPDSVDAYLARGEAYLQVREYAQALDDLQQAATLAAPAPLALLPDLLATAQTGLTPTP